MLHTLQLWSKLKPAETMQHEPWYMLFDNGGFKYSEQIREKHLLVLHILVHQKLLKHFYLNSHPLDSIAYCSLCYQIMTNLILKELHVNLKVITFKIACRI